MKAGQAQSRHLSLVLGLPLVGGIALTLTTQVRPVQGAPERTPILTDPSAELTVPTPAADSRPDRCEPNETREAACALTLDQVNGPYTFLPDGDQDWYRLELDATGLQKEITVRATTGLDLRTTISRDDGAPLGEMASPAMSTTLAPDIVGGEFQVLVENCDTKDVRDALTQVRAFGIVTIIANQLHRQLGDLADYALTAISNRVLLRTQEPDATLYARHYAESGITAADVAGQEPREHQYAWIGVHGKMTRLFSMRPLPWLPPLEVAVPPEPMTNWQAILPPDSVTPAFDQTIGRLMYGTHADPDAVTQALAASDSPRWEMLLERWNAIRAYQRQYILAHPGSIPSTAERQVWLARIRAARPRILAMAEYARIRQAMQPGATSTMNRRQAHTPADLPQISGGLEPKPTQQAYFPEIDQREPLRLGRVEPDDLTVESVEEGE